MSNKALDHKCPACAAPIMFKPKLGKWQCDYCHSTFELKDLEKHNNASNEKVNEGEKGDDSHYDLYKCKDCGAEVIADENTTSTFCLYCGNVAILKNKLSGKFAPSKIIPFKTEKEDAIKAFKKIGKFRPYMPRDFMSKKNIDKITGLYVPFWIFNVKVAGEVTATGSKVSTWTSGDYRYTKTDKYNVVREGEMLYQKIPVDGSLKFDNSIMNSIEPFDYKELIDYNHAYLSGFLAEKYDVESKDAQKDATTRATNSTLEEMQNDMKGYTSKIVNNNSLNVKDSSVEYALFPVWMVNVKYKDKYYLFAMNGQTGKFIGNLPKSTSRMIWISILTFIITFVAVILISYLVYKGGM